MKKLALGAVLGASLMISSSAFALTAMTDANMKSATGQAGVSIAIDNVVIEQYVGSTSYIDTDGVFNSADKNSSIVISDKHVLKTFDAMTSADDFKNQFATAAGFYSVTGGVASLDTSKVAGTWNRAAALTIDVGKCSSLTDGLNGNLDLAAGSSPMTTVINAAADDLAQKAVALKAATTLEAKAAASVAYETAKDAAIGNILGATYATTDFKPADASEAATYLKVAVLGKIAAWKATCSVADPDGDWTAATVTANVDLAAATTSVAGVVIGLPTLMTTTSADTYSVGVANDNAVNNGLNFIKISKGSSAMAILGGRVEIAAH